MTTGDHKALPDEWQHWALEQLDLPRSASLGEARSAALRQLGEMDFLPPTGWDCAVRVAGLAPYEGDPNAPIFLPPRHAAEEALREEVEEFVARFFSLSSDARLSRFQLLLAKCADSPVAAARLDALRPALVLPSELPCGQSPLVTELLDESRQLFILPRQERANRRWAFLRRCRGSFIQWRKASTIVEWKFPRYAALEPLLFQRLRTAGDRTKLRAKLARQRERAVRKERPAQIVTRTSQKQPWWIGIVAVVVLIASRSVTTSTFSHKPAGQVPIAPRFDVEKANRDMNEKVNDTLRRGEPLSESMRRLYGLPPEKKSSTRPPSVPPPIPERLPGQPPEDDLQRLQDLMRQLDEPSVPGSTP